METRKSDEHEDELFLSDEVTEEVDLQDLIQQIHSAEIWEPARPRGRVRGKHRSQRSARRELDEMAHDRALRDALVDWDDYDEFADYADYEERAH